MTNQSKTQISNWLPLIIALIVLFIIACIMKKEDVAEKKKNPNDQVVNPVSKKTIANEPKDNFSEKELPKLPDPPKDNF